MSEEECARRALCVATVFWWEEEEKIGALCVAATVEGEEEKTAATGSDTIVDWFRDSSVGGRERSATGANSPNSAPTDTQSSRGACLI